LPSSCHAVIPRPAQHFFCLDCQQIARQRNNDDLAMPSGFTPSVSECRRDGFAAKRVEDSMEGCLTGSRAFGRERR
jgi:hypothetical protein